MKPNQWKEKLHEVIFEAETPAGKRFDVILLIAILASVMVVMLESIPRLGARYGNLFYALEWGFTIFFTLEYLLRIYCVYKPIRYITSFFGLVDLLSILPTYLGLFIGGSGSLLVIRSLRLLRIFRIFKMVGFLKQARIITLAIKRSIPKILVFLSFVLVLVTIIGSLMYLIEGPVNPGFDSIPHSIYWAIVTLTTVGYGDITPVTSAGQLLSALVMLIGYAIIAVPTGIVSVDIVHSNYEVHKVSTQACKHCGAEGHTADAVYCKYCGASL